ncbi:MAG: S-layer protein, partial [Candidatus Diapherotrites archaeon]|nr:S-layer protein [Candidatus Diapherotrites archaeon]
MKRLNVKRLAALGAGIALLGTALAPVVSAIDLTKSDIVNDAGQPVVDVVVGSNAKVSDAIWAGNIATKIAQLAYTETPVSVDVTLPEGGEGVTPEATVSDISVELVIGGETTYAAGTA